MKILICYHSDTGNTKTVAESMAEGLSDQNVTILPASEVDPTNLGNYDIVFLGSGIYAAAVGKSIKKLMKNATTLPSKLVFFCTHSNPDPAVWGSAFKKIEKQISEKTCEVCAKFECIGENRNPQIVEMLIKTMPSMKAPLEAAIGHPNAAELEKAKEFAKSLIQKQLATL